MELYLDHNATTPLDERVLDTMLPYLGKLYGNPSSRHSQGRLARSAIDQAREQVAALVNAHPGQVIFTSGGTEANNLALKGGAAGMDATTLAISAVEHPSVVAPARRLVAAGWSLLELGVDSEGRVDPLELGLRVTQSDLGLVSVMWANNETGTVQDISALKVQLEESGAILHSDAVQAAGKLPIDFKASGVDMMSLSSHKIYGPKGAGALIAERAITLEPQLEGGGQERGLRAGTESVATIVGFGRAAELALSELEQNRQQLLELRSYLESRLDALPGVRRFAANTERLPNTLFMALEGVDGEMLLMQMDRHNIAISSGSACSSGKTEPSHVLLAMGVDPQLARSAIRVSLGRGNRRRDIDRFCEVLVGLTGEMSRTHAVIANG